MSASAKTPTFPRDCASAACAKPLQGPVKFCPYCGASGQGVAAPVASPVPVVASVAVAPAPAVAAVTPVATTTPVREVTAASHQLQRQPEPVPPVVTPVPPVPAARPGGLGRKLALVAVVLVGIGGYGAYQMNARKAMQQFEVDLAAGQGCLSRNGFDCALENAERALRTDSKDPRAISLLQRAQAGLDRQQREQDAKAQAAAAATAQAAARRAAAEQARSDKQAQEQVARELQARELALREQELSARREQQLLENQRLANQRALQQQHAPVTRPVTQPARQAVNPGLVGQQLSQARSALARRDGNAARVLANAVLRQDPSNRQAQNVLRQAEQLRGQVSFDRPKALGGVIIE